MSKRVAVVISEDPCVTARPVEALRIALGLCAGDHEITVILLGDAPRLLMENTDDILDVEILEKYLPSFKHLDVPFILEPRTSPDVWSNDFTMTTRTQSEIRQFIQTCDRSLIF